MENMSFFNSQSFSIFIHNTAAKHYLSARFFIRRLLLTILLLYKEESIPDVSENNSSAMTLYHIKDGAIFSYDKKILHIFIWFGKKSSFWSLLNNFTTYNLIGSSWHSKENVFSFWNKYHAQNCSLGLFNPTQIFKP